MTKTNTIKQPPNTQLYKLRMKLGKSAEDVVKELSGKGVNISRELLYRYERGHAVKFNTMKSLADYYKVPLDQLLIRS